MFMYFLVAEIYPRYSRFVKAIRQPIVLSVRKFTSFQEGARKDIERAFGVFQCKWQASARPIYLMDPILISKMITCCLLLHNIMCVSDRVRFEKKTIEWNQSMMITTIKNTKIIPIIITSHSVIYIYIYHTIIRLYDHTLLSTLYTYRHGYHGCNNGSRCHIGSTGVATRLFRTLGFAFILL